MGESLALLWNRAPDSLDCAPGKASSWQRVAFLTIQRWFAATHLTIHTALLSALSETVVTASASELWQGV